MVVVAIAGGSGHVGRTIVETLVENGEHEVIVLGRKVWAYFGLTKDWRQNSKVTQATPRAANFKSIVVDYSDVGVIAEALTQHGVHTVICTISVADETSSASQINLIKAAGQSSSVKRLIASGWGALPNEK
jgi:saccharopine dehydrogenase-like NADP-dependent oxidoreductase